MYLMMRMVTVSLIFSFLISCGSQKVILMEEPTGEGKLLVGAVLLENDGIDDVNESRTANITVIIVGQFLEKGEQVTKGYRIKSDKNGYFFIPNVPSGSFIIKGLEGDIGYANHVLISSRWEGNRQVFVQESGMIDFTVRVWPPASQDKIIDLKINYFKIDRTGRIYSDVFNQLKEKELGLKGKQYTMVGPKEYYKNLNPNSMWFK
jgi:hypothetical protein